MDQIAKDLETPTQHNSKILYWHLIKLRGNLQRGFVTLKDIKRVTINDKERVEERWAEYFDKVLNHDRATRKDIKKNVKVVTFWI